MEGIVDGGWCFVGQELPIRVCRGEGVGSMFEHPLRLVVNEGHRLSAEVVEHGV